MPSGILNSSPQKPCEWCMESFNYKPSIEKRGHARFCSRKCQNQWLGQKHRGEKRQLPESWYEGMRVRNLLRRGSTSPRRGKPAPWAKGENNVNWKGGVTSENNKQRVVFRKSMQSRIFARDNYTCQICDAYGASIQIDHIKSWSKYPELRFVESNCRTLCMACHYYVTFKRKLPQGVVWGHNLSQRTLKP